MVLDQLSVNKNYANEEELDEEPRNIILSMVSQLKMNMDLSRVTLPTFVLESRSFTERITDFLIHPEFLLGAHKAEDPLERFISGVKYFMSGWHVHPHGVKKPYNPILGEFFRSKHNLENNKKAYYISEQVSHHPPVSAFYYVCPEDEIHIEGELRPKGRFLGNSIGVSLCGYTRVYFNNRDEEYYITYPNIYARGILFGKMFLEVGEKASIECKKNDLMYTVDFKTKGFFGKEYNQVCGKIKRISSGQVLYEITGDWQNIMYIKDCTKKSESKQVFFDSSKENLTPLDVVPIEEQESNESRRLWNPTTIAIKQRNLENATKEKTKIEMEQRESVKRREETGEVWTSRFFTLKEDGNHHPNINFKELPRDVDERCRLIENYIFASN
ncbi:hypothetical protein BB559_003576 [Furculomyces boomerangus]|uniref:Oxysterol-binding protein n=2 Tax=Harpellales TaxID=61421 RepID=A0A2T9YKL1_9FUNG|nr:hypothetical protein BB559_003576 [Furculomyces boomerangus]PVZ98839.1 hypothetical protein BB558_005151 [Smittium angustum]